MTPRRATRNGASARLERPLFFLLSKVLGFFALPSNLMLTLGLVGVALMATRRARTGRWLAGTAIVLLAVFGLSPAGKLLIAPLEDRFPLSNESTTRRAATRSASWCWAERSIRNTSRDRGADLNEAADRITAVAALARRYPRARIVYSGGQRPSRVPRWR